MDPFATYSHIANAQQFWLELDEVLDSAKNVERDEEEAEEGATLHLNQQPQKPLGRKQIAAVLHSFLALIDGCYDKYLDQQQNQDYLISRLFDSAIFGPYCHAAAAEMIVHLMHKSTSLHVLLICYEIVLQYGESEPSVFRVLQHRSKEVLHRLTHHVWAGSYAAEAESRLNISSESSTHGVGTGPIPVGWAGADWQSNSENSTSDQNSTSTSTSTSIASGGAMGETSKASRNRLLQIRLRGKSVRLLYEVCRVQKLDGTDLKLIDEKFINHLFDLVEETRYHHDEGFNYQLIKLIVALNEQFMVSTLATPKANGLQSNSAPLGLSRPINSVLKVLKGRLNHSNTFGENIIYMLNRASSNDAEDLCMQLLVLKLLYLLFTTEETAHYFFTNDLRVLVDIFIRELSDLPDESESLRHTYLRVLHPLLTNTQLCTYAYKRPQIRRLLMGLTAHGHIKDISSTTKRLVDRCLKAEWCVELDNLDPATGLATVASIGGGATRSKSMHQGVTVDGLPYLTSNIDETPNSKATERTIAATEDQTSLSSSNSAFTSPALVSSSPALGTIETALQPPPPSILTASAIETNSPDSIESLPLPRTRDKRVLSLSNPRPVHSSVLAAAGQESPGGRRVASTSSARSAPPTPPRRDSTVSNSSLSINEMEGMTDSALSTASSWHAHMVDTSSNSSSTATPIPFNQARTPSPSSSTSSTSHHPYFHHSLSENPQSLPRVGSPLAADSTSHFFPNLLGSDHLSRTQSNDSDASAGMILSNLGSQSKSRNGTNDSNASSLDYHKPISTEDAKPMKPRRRPPPATPLAAAAAARQAELNRRSVANFNDGAEGEITQEVAADSEIGKLSSIKVPSLHIQEASGDQTSTDSEPQATTLASTNLESEAVEGQDLRKGRRALAPSSSEPSALSSNPTSRSASPSSQTGASSGGRRRPPPPPSPNLSSGNLAVSSSSSKAPPPPVNRALKSKANTPRTGTPDGEERERVRSASDNGNYEELYKGINGLRVG